MRSKINDKRIQNNNDEEDPKSLGRGPVGLVVIQERMKAGSLSFEWNRMALNSVAKLVARAS